MLKVLPYLFGTGGVITSVIVYISQKEKRILEVSNQRAETEKAKAEVGSILQETYSGMIADLRRSIEDLKKDNQTIRTELNEYVRQHNELSLQYALVLQEAKDYKRKYEEVHKENENNKKKILELEELLKNAELIKKPVKKEEHGKVDVGATVVVEADGEKDEFRIVGSYEANPVKNLISNESPVGQALLGAKIGDVIEVTTPVVKIKYKVLHVKYE